MLISGVGHIHTMFSSDGKLELGEVVELAKARGLSFLLLAEHAEGITGEDYMGIVAACDGQSREGFIVVPGLEFMYEGYVHLLGIGLWQHPGIHPLQEQVKEIRGLGGLAVLAHANTCERVPYDELGGVDGVEVWNSRYWGRFAPDSKGLAILDELRRRVGQPLHCFSGLDFHVNREFRTLFIEAEVDDFSEKALLTALGEGDFTNRNPWFRIGALEEPTALKRLLFGCVNAGYMTAKKMRGRINPK